MLRIAYRGLSLLVVAALCVAVVGCKPKSDGASGSSSTGTKQNDNKKKADKPRVEEKYGVTSDLP